MDDLLTELESADPAKAPDLADSIAAALSEQLESDESEDQPAAPA
jgi:hypothetical protein